MYIKSKISGKVKRFCTYIIAIMFIIVSFSGCKTEKNTTVLNKKPVEHNEEKTKLKIFAADVANYDDGYIFYVYNGIEGKTPEVTLKSGISVDEVRDFKFVSDKVYFYSQIDGMIEYMDLQGSRHKLEFTKNEDNYNCEFLISPDGKKIAWVELKPKSNEKNTYIINMADIDGNDKREIYKIDLNIMSYIGLQKWSKDGSRIFFGKKFDGLGGLIVMENLESLYSLDINTGKAEKIIGKDREYNNSEYISTVSDDDKFTVYFDGRLFARNIENSSENSFEIPIKNYLAVGQASLSPDNRYILYDIVEGNSNDQENYYIKHLIVDTTNGKTRILKAPEELDYTVIKWVSDTKVVFAGRTLNIMDVTSEDSFIPEETN